MFNVSYRVLWISLTLVGSIGGACGIKISQSFGAGDPETAQKQVRLCLSIIGLIILILSSFIAFNSRLIGKIFTDDPDILELFQQIRFPLALWMAAMNLSVANEIILSNSGRGKLVLYLGLIGSWVG